MKKIILIIAVLILSSCATEADKECKICYRALYMKSIELENTDFLRKKCDEAYMKKILEGDKK